MIQHKTEDELVRERDERVFVLREVLGVLRTVDIEPVMDVKDLISLVEYVRDGYLTDDRL